MKIKQFISGLFISLLLVVSTFSQVENWCKLKVLESDRNEVENILGKPETYLEGYGTYETKIGEFSVWYSKGGCRKDVEGLQYDIPAQRLTRILFYPKKSLPLEFYISDIDNFKKTTHPNADFRFFYTSMDESIIYQTILSNDSKEFVYTIELQPSKEQQKLLCGSNDNKGNNILDSVTFL